MPPDRRLELGRAGEDAALRRYLRAGYRLIARNWRCRMGELDLVLARGGMVVVCEVKARRPGRAGPVLGAPFEAVHHGKQRKVRMLAEAFLSAWPERFVHVRFDVASVWVAEDGAASVQVFEDAF